MVRILAPAVFLTVSAMAAAADPQLLNMVMPDAQVVAGVNVEQAKTSPFGQYVLSQISPQDPNLAKLSADTGFDPTRDVRELLVATQGANANAGLALARGQFDVAKISAAAKASGATVETYARATLIVEPNKKGGFAFPDGTIVVAGTVDLVKAALDRRSSTATPLSAQLVTKVNSLSTSQDAWLVSLVSPASLKAGHGPQLPGGVANQNTFQQVTQFNGGIKFGSSVVLTAEAIAQTAQDAASLAGVVQFLASLAQTQSNGDPNAALVLKSLTVAAQGTSVKIGLSLPTDQFQNLIKPHNTNAPRRQRKV